MELVHSQESRRRCLDAATDEELLAAVAAGDEPAFERLVERKAGPFLGHALRMLGERQEAEDVVQSALLRIWTRRRRYRPGRPADPWLFRILTNLALDRLRSRRSRRQAQRRFAAELVVVGGSTRHHPATLGDREVERLFAQLAVALTPRQRAVFVLRCIEGRSGRETAEILRCGESTVRSHLMNARTILQRELSRRFPEYLPASADRERG